MTDTKRKLRDTMKNEKEIYKEMTDVIFSTSMVSKMEDMTYDICKEITSYIKDWWSWNPDCNEPFLNGKCKTYELSKDDETFYESLINGSFTLTAVLKTPPDDKLPAWSGFIGGDNGAFWMGLERDKWCAGKQYASYADFCNFNVKMEPNKMVYIMLIRDNKIWDFYVNGNHMHQFRRSIDRRECKQNGKVTIGAGFPRGDELWKGEVHSIMIRPGVCRE